jgi:3',5'-cyclic AMP phosphodiesterase CpdA
MSPRLHCTADWHLRADARHDAPTVAALRRVVAAMLPGDWLLACGDLTDNGSDAEYASLRALLLELRLEGRVLLVPGNHDVGLQGLLVQAAARGRWARLVRELRSPARVQVGSLLVGALDSCLLTPWPGDLAEGRLGARQAARAQAICEDAHAACLRPVLAMHHWAWCRDSALRLLDAERVKRLVADERATVIAGHTHCAEERSGPGWRGLCLGALGAVGRAEAVGG